MGFLDSLKLERPDSYDLTEVLDYTPDSLSPLYEQFNSKNNRGLGFKKTVRQKFDDFEGLGPGFVSIRDDKERGVVTSWAPYMGKEWVDEQNEKLWNAESLMNLPLALAPLVPIVAGTKAISRQRDFSKTGSYKDTKGSRIYPFPEDNTGKTVNMEKVYRSTIDKAFLSERTSGHANLQLSAEQLGLQHMPGFTGSPYAFQSTIDWTRFGYKENKLPTQVKKAENPELVSESLNEFYSKVNRIIGSIEGSQGITSGRAGEIVKQIPTWWTHPETGKIYRSAWNSRENRLTIKPISRNLLENQQTSIIQKRNYRKYKKEIASMNETLRKELEKTQLELDKLDQELPAVMRHAGAMGKDGSSKSAVMNSFFAKRNELVTKIEDLLNSKYYTEHGYYLLSEKVRNKVLDNSHISIKNSKEFQLGNLNNQYVTKNIDKFSEFKTRIETAIDSLNEGYYNYPNLVVGYNPKLEGKEYVIRIEDLNSLKVGKDIKGVLSGNAILKIDFTDKELVKRLSSTEGVKQWLSENGIEASSKELSRKPESIDVRQDRKPLESTGETRNRIMSMLDQVFDMRVSIEDYLKSISATAGDPPKTKGRKKGDTDLKQRKTKNKDQGKLDIL